MPFYRPLTVAALLVLANPVATAIAKPLAAVTPDAGVAKHPTPKVETPSGEPLSQTTPPDDNPQNETRPDPTTPPEPPEPAPKLAPSAPPEPPAASVVAAPPPNDDFSAISSLSLEGLMNQKVVTATKTPTELRQIPNRVIVVGADEIRLRGYRYLIELVEDLPGIQSMNFVEAETGAHVIVRGVWQNNKILVLYNGHKITSPEGKDFIFGRHNWSLANVARVEFIFGPASALYGADAVSAVINIVPKDFQSLQNHVIEASLGYGVNRTVEADLSTGFSSAPFELRIDGAFHHSAGPNFLESYPSYYSGLFSDEYRRQLGQFDENGSPIWKAPSLSYHVALLANLGSSTRLHFLRIYSEEQSAMGFRPPLFEFSPENKWAWYQNNAGLTNEIHLGESVTLRTLLTYNHQECDPKTQFINSFFDGGESFTRADYKMFRSVRMGVVEELVHNGSLFGEHLQIVVGGRFEDIYSLTKMSTTTGQAADLRYPLNYQSNAAIPNGEVSFHALGGYFQAQYDILPNVNLVAGMNVDKVWHYDTAFNPRVGAAVSPTETLTLRASAAKAYLTPAPAYQFEGFNNGKFPGPGTVGAIPNTDLRPENYLTFEGGLAAMLLSRQLLLDVSAFHTANDNYLLRQRRLVTPGPVSYTPTIGNTMSLTIPENQVVLTSENGGMVRAYGGEVSLTANTLKYVRPWANYSLVLGSQKETPTRTGTGINTDYLANQAQHQIKGGAEIRPFGRLALVPSFVWYGRTKIRTDALDVEQFPNGLKPFFLLNASLLWEGDRVQFWARAHNVLNARYYRPGGPVSQQAATRVPQERFSGEAGVRILY